MIEPEEEWRDVVGWEGLYQVSDLGQVRTVERRAKNGRGTRRVRSRILRPQNQGHYDRVGLSRNSHVSLRYVHHLVLEAFVGPAPEGEETCHEDGQHRRNLLSNLSWGTHVKNCEDRGRHGNNTVGERHGMAKLTEAQAIAIRQDTRTQLVISAEYGISQSQVCHIKTGKSWGHLA